MYGIIVNLPRPLSHQQDIPDHQSLSQLPLIDIQAAHWLEVIRWRVTFDPSISLVAGS